jgi:hypothetical protein
MSGTRIPGMARSTRKKIPVEVLGLLFFKGGKYDHEFIVKGTYRSLAMLGEWARENRIAVRAARNTWGSYLLSHITPISTKIARQKIRKIIATKDKPLEEMWLT